MIGIVVENRGDLRILGLKPSDRAGFLERRSVGRLTLISSFIAFAECRPSHTFFCYESSNIDWLTILRGLFDIPSFRAVALDVSSFL